MRRKPACLSKFTYHSGLVRPQKAGRGEGGLKGNINKLFRNPPASLAFKTSVAQQEMQSNNDGKCCCERCVGEMNDGGGLGCLKKTFVF